MALHVKKGGTMPGTRRDRFHTAGVLGIPAGRDPRRFAIQAVVLALFPIFAMPSWSGCAGTSSARADLETARQNYLAGNYREALAEATKETDGATRQVEWWRLRLECEWTLGEYEASLETLDTAITRLNGDLRLRLRSHHMYKDVGKARASQTALEDIDRLVRRTPWRYSSAEDLVALGETALAMGGDARQVLEFFFDRAREREPDNLAAHLASGELALEKGDFAEAARVFEQAAEKFPDHPTILFGLARSHAESDWPRAQAQLQNVLEANPRHAGALLLLADRQIDAEQYASAETLLAEVLETNPRHPVAWAYRSVIAYLQGDFKNALQFQNQAGEPLPGDPQTWHILGRELSQHYRFAEGAEYQRRALKVDPMFLPAKLQLAQDLLRLGEETEGWQLANEVQNADGYNVLAFNLATLEETVSRFRTMQDGDFIVRMDAVEAERYGKAVLELLHRAKETLCPRYEVTLQEPVIVEIFPAQPDFAVRTFGMPGGEGFLAVCFGKVITANSPASQRSSPANWQATLWHEFCHVVTLDKTRNRMPRWLSEGISVYEERQAHLAWGQGMTPRYRQMILEGELTPVGKLSEAFLSPPSPVHLQFAYYQSSLVVEFIVQEYGQKSLLRTLMALGAGVPMNEALERHVAPLHVLEQDFEEFARLEAEALAPFADWSPPLQVEGQPLPDPEEWLPSHPRGVWGLSLQLQRLVEQENWEEALLVAEWLCDLVPPSARDAAIFQHTARVYQELDMPDAERHILEEWATADAAALPAYERLMQIAEEREDWEMASKNAERFLAVNPLAALPHRVLARASQELERPWQAISAHEALLTFEPADQAQVHFRLAELLHTRGTQADVAVLHQEAKRHLLLALEQAPRYQEALEMLLKIQTVSASEAEQNDLTPEETTDSEAQAPEASREEETHATP